MWSIVEEAGRRWIAACTDEERGWVPRRGRESWLGLMWEVESLRRGAVFGRSHASITPRAVTVSRQMLHAIAPRQTRSEIRASIRFVGRGVASRLPILSADWAMTEMLRTSAE